MSSSPFPLLEMVSDEPVAPRRSGVIRGGSEHVADHAFAAVSELPVFSVGADETADPVANSYHRAAWDRGLAEGRDEGRRQGRSEGFATGQEEGRRAGHAEGWQAGQAQAQAELAARVDPVLASLEDAAADLAARHEVALADIETDVVNLAVALAEAILQRELAVTADPGRQAITRALALAPERGDLVVRIHPDDHATLAEADRHGLAPGRRVELVADPQVGPGGCLVETDVAQVDVRIETALDRARAVLLGTEESPAQPL